MEIERSALSGARSRIEELELEVERLETECDVRDAQKAELETKIGQMTSEWEKVRLWPTKSP
jgi:chromosome segregation ATPase